MKKWNLVLVVSLLFILTSCTGQAQQKTKKDAKESLKVSFIELGSVRCIPCQKMQTVIKEVETNFPNQVKTIFYDVWTKEGKPYAEQYHIDLIPTQVFLDVEGKEFYRHQGFSLMMS